jgi:hypothetical protein
MPWSLLPDGIERLTLVLPNGEVNIAALLNDVNADAPKQSKILVERQGSSARIVIRLIRQGFDEESKEHNEIQGRD